MKYLLIIGDGMADYPLEDQGNRTPLQLASTLNMDFLADHGKIGLVKTVPDGFEPGSDVANLCLMGYDPRRYYTGRAAFEALGMGIKPEPGEVFYRCNLVKLAQPENLNNAVMEDFSGGHITTAASKRIIDSLNNAITHEHKWSDFEFSPGVSYRHILRWKQGDDQAQCTPPHDIIGKHVAQYIPDNGSAASTLVELETFATKVLNDNYPESTANSIWLWGQGKKPELESFPDKWGVTGSVITAVDLIRGLGVASGLKIIKVPGANGYLDTNFKGKAEYALKSLEKDDFVMIHVEAPDEAGHSGKLELKIKAIEDFDKLVVGEILANLDKRGKVRILLCPDHATPLRLRTHTREMVPFVLYDNADKTRVRTIGYHEWDQSEIPKEMLIEDGHLLISRLFTDDLPFF